MTDFDEASGSPIVGGETPCPTWRDLFRGAVRESLAATNSVARIGTQDTHAWEKPIRYVVDDNQGNVAVVEFQPNGVIGALSVHSSVRLDRLAAFALVPHGARDRLAALCDLPLLREGQGVSAIMWSDGEHLQGPERWHYMGRTGMDLLRRELMTDLLWANEGPSHYAITPEVAELAVSAAARAKVSTPILRLTDNECGLLVPKGSAHEEEAIDLLFSDGIFEVGGERALME